jgi:hypothetical protein
MKKDSAAGRHEKSAAQGGESKKAQSKDSEKDA